MKNYNQIIKYLDEMERILRSPSTICGYPPAEIFASENICSVRRDLVSIRALIENDWIDQKPTEQEIVRMENEDNKNISIKDLQKWVKDNLQFISGAQIHAIWDVRLKWDMMAMPYFDTLNGCIMVQVGHGVNPMWLGIEKDGYTHS